MKIEDICQGLRGRLAGRCRKIQNETDYFSAAVVLPLVPQGEELGILFEVRSPKLTWQPGEICFPGGRIEAAESPGQAALRETCEELRIMPQGLAFLGPLDYLVSPIGVILYPYVGYIAEPQKIRPNNGEVAEIFTVPLRFLLENDPFVAEMEVATRPLPGFPLEHMPPGYPSGWRSRASYPVYFYRYQGRVIWGITARVLNDFILLCRDLLAGE
ncbi:MAG TPA: CoA pyrophosphatase [Selenomonadales bacterium]|nr:CoA pyrophosphatase [Selenomonadales bacterium]